MSGLYRNQLPAVLAGDEMFVNFVRIFEDIGTPLYDAATGFPSMFDPHIAPPDLARYLGSWLGLAIDELLPPDRRRKVTVAAARYFGTRGTRGALEALLSAVTGGSAAVVDPGWIRREDDVTPIPAGNRTWSDRTEVEVILSTRGRVPLDRLEGLLRNELPAWVPFRIVVEDESAVEEEAS